MASLREKLALGAFWTILFRVATRFVGIISTAILARLLVPEDFGLVALAVTSVALMNAFTEFGPEQYLISHQDSGRNEYDTAWTLQILRGAAIALLMYIFSENIAGFFRDPRLADVVTVMSAAIFLRSFSNIGIVDFRKKLNFDKDFQILLIPRLASFFTTISLAFILKNYWALVIGYAVGHLAHLIASYVLHQYRPRFNLRAFGKVFGFSKWLFANSILQFTINKFDTFLVGRVLGAGTLGVYSLSFEISTLATTELAAPLRRAILPGYSKIAKNPAALRKLYLDVFALSILVTVPAAIGIMLTSDLIVQVLLGEKWLEAIPIIEIIAISGALQAASSGAGALFLAVKKPRFITFTMLATLALCIPLMIWAASAHGIIGVAWSLVATWTWRQLLTFYFVVRVIGTRPIDHFNKIWRSLLSVAVMYATVETFRSFYVVLDGNVEKVAVLLGCGLLGSIAYVVSHLALWIICGRPDGAEVHIVSVLELFVQKLTKKKIRLLKVNP